MDLFTWIVTKTMKKQKENDKKQRESSFEVKKRVNFARKIQLERFKNDNIFCNSKMSSKHIKKYCEIVRTYMFINLRNMYNRYSYMNKMKNEFNDYKKSKMTEDEKSASPSIMLKRTFKKIR